MDKEEATRRGAALLKRMKGKGWTLEVWDNHPGWQYAVRNGPLTVHANKYPDRTTYYPLLADEAGRGWGGSFNWSPRGENYRDPNHAVQAQLKAARRYVDQVEAIVSRLEAATA